MSDGFISKEHALQEYLRTHPAFKKRFDKFVEKTIEHQNLLESILALRRQNKTMREIGEKFGLSKENIRKFARHIPDWPHRVKFSTPILFKCKQCGKEEMRSRKIQRKYCSQECRLRALTTVGLKHMTVEERRKHNSQRSIKYRRERLDGTEEYKAKVKLYNKRAYEKRKMLRAKRINKLKNDPRVIAIRKMFDNDR